MQSFSKSKWESKINYNFFYHLFIVAAVIYSLYLPNIYESEALLSPVGEEAASNQSINNISGIASLTGISLSSQSGGNPIKSFKENKDN